MLTAAGNALFDRFAEYERRSLAHEAKAEGGERGKTFDGVVFRLADYHLTLGIDEVTEILGVPQATPVPGAKPWLLGVANLRGNLAPLVDLAWFLFNQRTPLTSHTRVLVLSLQNRPIAVLIDEVVGQRHFADNDAAPPETFSGTPLAPYMEREFQQGNITWGQLRISALVNQPEFMNGAAD